MVVVSLLLLAISTVLLVLGKLGTDETYFYASVACSLAAGLLLLIAWGRDFRKSYRAPGDPKEDGTPTEATWNGGNWGNGRKDADVDSVMRRPVTDTPDSGSTTTSSVSETTEIDLDSVGTNPPPISPVQDAVPRRDDDDVTDNQSSDDGAEPRNEDDARYPDDRSNPHRYPPPPPPTASPVPQSSTPQVPKPPTVATRRASAPKSEQASPSRSKKPDVPPPPST